MKRFKTKIFVLLFFISIFGLENIQAQYKPPYKIVNKYGDEIEGDSIWVLFADIRSANRDILAPADPIISPKILKVGDSIILDSGFRLSIRITEINYKDSNWCTVTAIMPERQNAILVLRYRTFGDIWVFDGSTKPAPLVCDQLSILLWDPKFICFRTSQSLNCE
ncbi:MAG: hypothetical protein JNM67_01115 [Bacteroidetes bacterium]|nr:hypothetical protein [Bacteroidota bacterium]